MKCPPKCQCTRCENTECHGPCHNCDEDVMFTITNCRDSKEATNATQS